MDISLMQDMFNQYQELEGRLIEFINKENIQFQETEEMKILQAYSDTAKSLINAMRNELANPYRLDIRDLNPKDIQMHHKSAEYFLTRLKMDLNVKYGVSKWVAMSQFSKDIDKLIKL